MQASYWLAAISTMAACAAKSAAPPLAVTNVEADSMEAAARLLAKSMEVSYEGPVKSRPMLQTLWRAHELYASLCLDGNANACLTASRHPPFGIEDAIFKRIARNCTAGHTLSCRWNHTPDESQLETLSLAQLREGCVVGVDTDCLALAETGSLRDARFGYDTACAYSHMYCDEAVDSYLKNKPRDPERARYLLELTCQRDDLFACHRLAYAYEQGELAEPTPGRRTIVKAFLCESFKKCGELTGPEP